MIFNDSHSLLFPQHSNLINVHIRSLKFIETAPFFLHFLRLSVYFIDGILSSQVLPIDSGRGPVSIHILLEINTPYSLYLLPFTDFTMDATALNQELSYIIDRIKFVFLP